MSKNLRGMGGGVNPKTLVQLCNSGKRISIDAGKEDDVRARLLGTSTFALWSRDAQTCVDGISTSQAQEITNWMRGSTLGRDSASLRHPAGAAAPLCGSVVANALSIVV